MATVAGPVRFRDPYTDHRVVDFGQHNNNTSAAQFLPIQNNQGTQNGTYVDNSHPAAPVRQANSHPTEIEVLCGPLVNYLHLTYAQESAVWHGTVLIVTKPGDAAPELEYGPVRGERFARVEALKLYQDLDKTFWRFSLDVPLSQHETEWEYFIPRLHFLSNVSNDNGRRTFFVPGSDESMRIMFHSCNGFSVGTDEDFWSGTNITPFGDDFC